MADSGTKVEQTVLVNREETAIIVGWTAVIGVAEKEMTFLRNGKVLRFTVNVNARVVRLTVRDASCNCKGHAKREFDESSGVVIL